MTATTIGPSIDAVQPADLGHVRGGATPAATCPDERRVAAALVAGDRWALEAAFRSWGDLVHGIARQRVGRDAADDVTQQVFVQAWRSRT